MEPKLKSCLKAITLELRHELEGQHDANGEWHPGDLERRLAEIGVWRDRPAKPAGELAYRSAEDREARRVVDAFLKNRVEAGLDRAQAVEEFVREAAYTWANRILALRCMEVRGLIDEVILQKEVYGRRSLQHQRLAKKAPERCTGEDEGLFAMLFDEFERQAVELPLLFNPRAPEVALRPSVAAIKRCIGLLSGTVTPKGQEPATDEVFSAPDALGWTYQYWNTDEKGRVFEEVRTKKGAKIEGAEIIPATCIYTEPYMVKFLVQNSLGASWMGMYPTSRLCDAWEHYVRDADRAPVTRKRVREITFLDLASGSGHFLIEAFDLFYGMYLEEAELTDPATICGAILEHNLYGIDIDERAVQIAALALVMKAKEKAPDFVPRRVNVVATNIHLPASKEHLEAFLKKHPEDAPLKPALLTIFEGLAHADELGSLLEIEEPVEKELQYIRHKLGAQLSLGGPQTTEEWSAWKQRAIDRLRQHFDVEAHSADAGAAFFGEAGAKGVSLVDVLSRRFDVVATNPPYMGSKNMGAILKRYVEHRFAPGKRDLFAAFILRCLRLATEGGRVAMVTQQSWMFLRSFADLRALDDENHRSAPRIFGGVLRETTIEALAHLGPRAFGEIGGEVVNIAVFVLARLLPPAEHRLTAFRLVGLKGPEEKDAALRDALSPQGKYPAVFRPRQARFLSIPEAPLSYWLSDRFLNLLAGRRLADVARIVQQVITADNQRFLRFWWEIPDQSERWLIYLKAGGYSRWSGFESYLLDWRGDGSALKQSIIEKYPYLKGNWGWLVKEETFFEPGWTYTLMAQGCFGARVLNTGRVCDSVSPVIVLTKPFPGLGAVLNCRVTSYLLRASGAGVKFRESYVLSLPLPQIQVAAAAQLEAACVSLKDEIIACDPTERAFALLGWEGTSLTEAYRNVTGRTEAVAAVLHAIEGQLEHEVFRAYDITGDDVASVLDETGVPAGWFPVIDGLDHLPAPPESMRISPNALNLLRFDKRRAFNACELTAIREGIRGLYQAGPGGMPIEANSNAPLSEDEEEVEDNSATGARIPIPAETFLEELSQKLKIHPISVCWLLREGRENDGSICPAELGRFVEDYVSVLVLRLLGHRWPRQSESEEADPEWADRDWIIPITEGTNEPILLNRVRDRIAEDFGAESVGAIEREFANIAGKSLSAWLASEFFKRHISQFKKRPIAWQVTSALEHNERGRRPAGGHSSPVFSCLLYYHRLDGDLLPKLRSQYVGPLRSRFQTELTSLEKLKERTPDQETRRIELEAKIEELRTLDRRLEEVFVWGFDCALLENVAAKEPLDKWTSQDGLTAPPESREALLAQERGYYPNPNDGVRVNIAPLQRAGLLAADVLATKDVVKAIADRARWRADERRWCRAAKLRRLGWWSLPTPQGG